MLLIYCSPVSYFLDSFDLCKRVTDSNFPEKQTFFFQETIRLSLRALLEVVEASAKNFEIVYVKSGADGKTTL
jgi:hypothetical protein